MGIGRVNIDFKYHLHSIDIGRDNWRFKPKKVQLSIEPQSTTVD